MSDGDGTAERLMRVYGLSPHPSRCDSFPCDYACLRRGECDRVTYAKEAISNGQ